MRTWGRTGQVNGVGGTWTLVETAGNGDNSMVYLTTLIQNLRLNLGESPFYANNGIPAYQSVMTQIAPDFYVSRIQQQFAQYFASLTITRVQNTTQPTYNVQAVTLYGAVLNEVIPV